MRPNLNSGAGASRFHPGLVRRREAPIGVSVVDRALMNRRLKRFANPVVPNMADRQAWMLYDRTIIATNAATPTSQLFFTVPTGQPVGAVPKPKTDTNMVQSGRLEDPQRFFMTALRIIVASDALSVDLNALLSNYFLEFWIGGKIYQEGPLVLFPGGAGVSGFSTKTNESNWNNGIPSPAAINLLGEEGVWILQGQQFRVEMKTTNVFTTSNATDATGLDILAVLDGILYRQVQ
jgi:hypothetical protein